MQTCGAGKSSEPRGFTLLELAVVLLLLTVVLGLVLPEASSLLTDIAWYRQGGVTRRSSRLSNAERRRLRQAILRRARQRYDAVLECWSSKEFSGYTSYRWASGVSAKGSHRARVCESVAGDALAYVDLVLSWHVFTRAVERLPFDGNSWLFS